MLRDSLKKFSLVSYVIIFAAGCFITRIGMSQRGKLTDLPHNIAIFKMNSLKNLNGLDKVKLSLRGQCLISHGIIKVLSQHEGTVLAAPLKDMSIIAQTIADYPVEQLLLVNSDSKLLLCDKEPKVIYGASF